MLQDLDVERVLVGLRAEPVDAAVPLVAPRLLLELRGELAGGALDRAEALAERVGGAAERRQDLVQRALEDARADLVDVVVEGRDRAIAGGLEVLVLAGEELVPAAVGPLDLRGQGVHLPLKPRVRAEVALAAEARHLTAELVERRRSERRPRSVAELDQHQPLLVGSQLSGAVGARRRQEFPPPLAGLDLVALGGDDRRDRLAGLGDLTLEGGDRRRRGPRAVEDPVG